MDIDQMIDFIKSQKKYSSDKYVFDYYDFIYTIEDSKYCADLVNFDSLTYGFYINVFSDFKTIDVKFNCNYTEEQILRKFAEGIRYFNKTHKFLKKQQNDIKYLTPIITEYINSQFPENSQNSYNILFYFKSNIKRKKKNSTLFDIKKEKVQNVKYGIVAHFIDSRQHRFSFEFEYYSFTNTLYLTTINYDYNRNVLDITKIVRSEKLKNLLKAEQ